VLRVWGRRGAFNVQKVMWLVGELGLPHEHIPARAVHRARDSRRRFGEASRRAESRFHISQREGRVGRRQRACKCRTANPQARMGSPQAAGSPSNDSRTFPELWPPLQALLSLIEDILGMSPFGDFCTCRRSTTTLYCRRTTTITIEHANPLSSRSWPNYTG
jgi:hypothetical protein